MKFLVEEHAGLFTAVRHALSEFGGYTLWQGGRRFVPIQVAEKQRCLIRATVRGPEGHASTIVPGSASEKLGTLLSRIASRRLPVHVTPIARLVLESMATALPCREQLAIRGLFMPQVGTPLMRLLGSAAQTLAPLLCNTATPIGVRGGNGSKVVPTEFSVDLDGRVRPGFRTADLLGELESLADRRATFELVSEEPAAPANPDLSLMPVLRDVMRERDPGCLPIPMLLPGYTDARYTSRLGVQTYRFLPMRLPPEIGTWLVHAANERIPAETLEFGTTCLLDVIRRYR
jgi:acetylornithine deacetylase/succinyl-diaminopimelate desuccinylase-like protein